MRWHINSDLFRYLINNEGDGGYAGHGSGGGGACGGISYGIYASGQGGTSLGSWLSGNTLIATGSPGNGGTGGLSLATQVGMVKQEHKEIQTSCNNFMIQYAKSK